MQHLAFEPREGAFTYMFRECDLDVAKALEVWQAMQTRPGVRPNNISYRYVLSRLSKACFSLSGKDNPLF